jgi:hypothetical protein
MSWTFLAFIMHVSPQLVHQSYGVSSVANDDDLYGDYLGHLACSAPYQPIFSISQQLLFVMSWKFLACNACITSAGTQVIASQIIAVWYWLMELFGTLGLGIPYKQYFRFLSSYYLFMSWTFWTSWNACTLSWTQVTVSSIAVLDVDLWSYLAQAYVHHISIFRFLSSYFFLL